MEKSLVESTLLNDRVTLSVGYFWTRYRNLILSVQDAAACGVERGQR